MKLWLIVVALLGFASGAALDRGLTPEPKVIFYETQLPPKEIVREVIKEVPKEVIIEREIIKEVPNYEFRPFASKQELIEWLNANKVEDMGVQACAAEALELQKRAFRDGYQMSIQVLSDGRTIPQDEESGAVNSTIIGKVIYFIDPVEGYVWAAGYAIEEVWR